MATCFFLLQNYDKCIEKATLSIDLKPTQKAYYRRHKAYVAKRDYENGIKDLEKAIMMDTSD